jgi:hypothetical protein
MADSDDLYARRNADDDLSTALGTETLADRDMVPAEFENTATSSSKSADTLPVEVYGRRGYLRVERSRYLAKWSESVKVLLFQYLQCLPNARESSAAQRSA